MPNLSKSSPRKKKKIIDTDLHKDNLDEGIQPKEEVGQVITPNAPLEDK